MQHHLASSKRAGLTEEDWKALKNPATSHFTEQEKAALTYAEQLTRTPTANVSKDSVAHLKGLFTDEQLVDLTATVALANFTNRISDGLAIELEFDAQTI